MGGVRVVTDSTADLDRSLAAELGVTIVPHTVHWNNTSFLDGVDLTLDDFYKLLKEGDGVPRTSRLSPGQLAAVYAELLGGADSVISLHVASRLSKTHESAVMAAREVAPGRISVVDSGTISGPLGMLVLRVATLARQGATLEDCVNLASDIVPRLRLFIVLDTLEYLRRGGRIGRIRSMAASLLSIKPIIQLVDGEFIPIERTRARGAAIRRLVMLLEDLGSLEEVGVLYGDDPAPANQLAFQIEEKLPRTLVTVGRTGPACGAHAGPGVFGVAAWLRK